MRLSHLHLPNPISYTHSLKLQEALLEKHFIHKTLLRNNPSTLQPSNAPPPTLLTFQTHPTYTVGRRHLKTNPLSSSQISFLTGTSSSPTNTNTNKPTSTPQSTQSSEDGDLAAATFYPSPRGGLLTYHAPGQLTAYLTLDLRTHALTPRCYIRLLEHTVIRTCARHGVPNTLTTEDPGVWIGEYNAKDNAGLSDATTSTNNSDTDTQLLPSTRTTNSNANSDISESAPNQPKHTLTPTTRKICAIGVHVSRGITSHGIGLNVYDAPFPPALQHLYTSPQLPTPKNANDTAPPQHLNRDQNLDQDKVEEQEAQGYLSWGFRRIVACGLEGKSVTWLSREQHSAHTSLSDGTTPRPGIEMEDVATTLAQEVARSLGIDTGAGNGVQRIGEDDVFK